MIKIFFKNDEIGEYTREYLLSRCGYFQDKPEEEFHMETIPKNVFEAVLTDSYDSLVPIINLRDVVSLAKNTAILCFACNIQQFLNIREEHRRIIIAECIRECMPIEVSFYYGILTYIYTFEMYGVIRRDMQNGGYHQYLAP